MKQILVCLMAGVMSISSQAQPVMPDSILRELRNTPADTVRIKQLVVAVSFLPYIQTDSALVYADTLEKYASQAGFTYARGWALSHKAEAYFYQGNYFQSLFWRTKAFDLFRESRDDRSVADMYGYYSHVYAKLGQTDTALFYLNLSKSFFPQGTTQVYAREYDTYLPVEELTNFLDAEIARIYTYANIPDSAYAYAQIAVDANFRLKHVYHSWYNGMLGNAYLGLHQWRKALDVFNLPWGEGFGRNDTVDIYNGKAVAFFHLGLSDSSIFSGKSALELASKINYGEGRLKAADILSKVYEKSNPDSSIYFLRLNQAINDSLFGKEKLNQFNNFKFSEDIRRRETAEAEKTARSRFRFWTLLGILLTALAAGGLLWRNVRHKARMNQALQREKDKLEKTLSALQLTQAQLVQSEKMASLGELTAGIAHEIQNPLNFVNNFSEVNTELIGEMKKEISAGNYPEVSQLADDLAGNMEKITEHGKRADAIVKSMLQHSRTSTGQKEMTDINPLVDEYARLAFHGMRAKDKSFNTQLKTDYAAETGAANIVPQDIGRVLLNLFNNAFYAVNEKKHRAGEGFAPEVGIATRRVGNRVEVSVTDNGDGIPEKIREKIFQPFFTTKPTGEGTGLGLSLSYDIITKGHGGEIKMTRSDDGKTTFKIHLPS